MDIKLLTEHHLEFLSLKGGCTDSSESTLVKMPRCWKSHFFAVVIRLKKKSNIISYNKLMFFRIFSVYIDRTTCDPKDPHKISLSEPMALSIVLPTCDK